MLIEAVAQAVADIVNATIATIAAAYALSILLTTFPLPLTLGGS